MSRARFWIAVTSGTLPALILASGLLPPHVHPPLLGAIALAALLLALGLAGSGTLPSPRSAIAVPLLTVSALAVLSAGMALQPMRSMRQIVVWFVGGLVAVAARSVPSDRHASHVAATIAVTASLLAALGLYQSLVAFPALERMISRGDRPDASAPGLTGPLESGSSPSLSAGDAPIPAGAEEARLRSGRAVGTLGLPALLASILVVGIPIAAAACAAGKGPLRAVWGASVVIQLAALAATRSVGGAAALVAATAIGIALWSDRRPTIRRGVLVAILIAASAAAVPRLLVSGEGSAAQAVALRWANWKAAVSMIVSHPVLGAGPGDFGVAFPQHRTAASNETQHAHNAYLEIVSDLGLLVLPFLVLVLSALLRWIKEVSRSKDPPGGRIWLGRALAVGCLAWAFQNLVDFGAYVAASLIPFAAAAGLLAREARAGIDPPRALLPARTLAIAAAVLAVLVGVPDAVSRLHLDRAVIAAGEKDVDRACAEAERSVRWNPLEPESRAALAGSSLDRAAGARAGDPQRAGDIARALREAEEAVRLDPLTANRRALLARARAAAGDVAGAYAAMAVAVRLNPFRPSYARERDALAAILAGDSAREPSSGRAP